MNINDPSSEKSMNQNVAVGIIIFQPNDSVLQRIREAILGGYRLFIFDNSPDHTLVRDFIRNEADESQVTYLTCGKNVGLGFGLSMICAQAYYESFPTLLFFDQDTVYTRKTLEYISDFYSKNIGLSDQYSSITFNSKAIDAYNPSTPPVKDVLLVINSGSLYYLDNLKKMNWHNTKYFVDCVDFSFCLSSSIHRFKLGEHSATPDFDHLSEQGDTNYKIFGIVLPIRAYRFSRIWDSYTASIKLIFHAIVTGKFKYAGLFFSYINKYLFVQFYIRFAKLFHLKNA